LAVSFQGDYEVGVMCREIGQVKNVTNATVFVLDMDIFLE
jgi:hypothetical protein